MKRPQLYSFRKQSLQVNWCGEVGCVIVECRGSQLSGLLCDVPIIIPEPNSVRLEHGDPYPGQHALPVYTNPENFKQNSKKVLDQRLHNLISSLWPKVLTSSICYRKPMGSQTWHLRSHRSRRGSSRSRGGWLGGQTEEAQGRH